MDSLLLFFIVFPVLTYLISCALPAKSERVISGWVYYTLIVHLAALTLFIVKWIADGRNTLHLKHLVLYSSPGFEFSLHYFFDINTALFALLGSVVLVLVTRFSKFYMHRDNGFKRYFTTFLLFNIGYHFVVFSGNFETLFLGWEVLGLCSFLLISFYRDRYLPVKNAMKVISLYRFGDVCLLLAIWMCHHVFNENITFIKLYSDETALSLISENGIKVGFIISMIMITAAIKSALFPFSSWLPRAMEGPTSSSAVFYGSLSVHLGLFLLIRTHSLWHEQLMFKALLIILGVVTSLVAFSISRVQPTVKTQIAYATIAQIGIICVEIAIGWHMLALMHILSHAFFRVYQLLVSPSVLSYKVHDMVFHFKPGNKSLNSVSSLQSTLFVLSIKEWSMDWLMYRLCWSPFKWIGKKIHVLDNKLTNRITAILFAIGILYFLIDEHVPAMIDHSVTLFYIAASLFLILRSFTERGPATRAWIMVTFGQAMLSLAISHNEHVPLHRILIYLSGVTIASIVGWLYLKKTEELDNHITLDQYHGYSYSHKKYALIFLICCLALLGFPFTPTFLGIDLLFTHIHEHQYALLIITALCFVFIEIAILRIYSRVFMGQSKKLDHAMAFRSS